MSNENVEMSAPSLTNQKDYRKHQGVHPTKSGKWGAAILHPITKVSVCLGSYDTPKEAADAFIEKKLEYQSLAVHKTHGFMNTKSGIQGANIQDPGNYESIFRVDNANVYAKEMHEFDSLVKNANVEETGDTLNRNTCGAKVMDQTDMNCTESKLCVTVDVIANRSIMTNQPFVDTDIAICAEGLHVTNVCSKSVEMLMSYEKVKMSAPSPTNQIDHRRQRGVHQTKSGKWGAAILHPINKDSVWHKTQKTQDFVNTKPENCGSVGLVTCNSAEDFANVYARKMLEFDSLVKNAIVEENEGVVNTKMCEAEFMDQTEMNRTESVGNTDVANRLNKSKGCYRSLEIPMSNENLEVSAPSPSNQTDYRNHRGVHPTKSGKWGATILHPITKVSMWLGIYDTAKEAADAYTNKKVEYQSLLVHKTQDFVNTKLGIQRAKNHGPGSNESESLGNCNSAQNLYAREMLVFDSVVTDTYVEETVDALNRKTCEANFMDQTEMSCTESKLHVTDNVIAQSSKMTNHPSVDLAEAASNTEVALHARRIHGSGSIYRTKSGKWRAKISYRNSQLHVGIYSTYDEAEAAIHKKRQDLDSAAHVEEVSKKDRTMETSKQSVTSIESMHGVMACDQHPEMELNVIRPCGTYETVEQAFEDLNRKRREFALLKDADKKCKQMINVAVEELQAQNSTTANCKVELIECKGDDETALFTKSQDIGYGDCSSNMEDIQVPCSSTVSNQELDNSIVNAYGQLVGEFSRLDDDLWLLESLDDVDEN